MGSNSHLVEVLLSQIGYSFDYLEIISEFGVLRALDHIHTPKETGRIEPDNTKSF